MSLPTVIVAGTVNEPSGTSLVSGSHSVTFTTTAEIVDAAGNVLVPKGRSVKGSVVGGVLKATDGTSALTLYASDNGATTVPYDVRESWRGGRQFTVNLLTTMVSGGHIAYSTLGPVSPPPVPSPPYAFLADVATRDAAVLTAAEAYTDAHAGGGGAVSSVNGHVGTVVLGASDVGADAAGVAAAVQTNLTAEVTRATAAEATNATAISAEATARSSADAAEVTARNAAITTAINGLLNGAPAALDTLKELADAINDDASFAATITTALAGKQPLDSDLTAIAALSTTTFGRAFLTMADAAATKTVLALVKGDVGLGNVDNTADTAKPVSTAQAAAFAPITTTTLDLIDRTNNTTETVPAGTTTNCSTAGVTKTAPALAGSVGTPPLRFAVKNLSTGSITVVYPDQAGSAQSLTMLTGETRTFRQKSTSGWGVESGALALSTLDGRFAPVANAPRKINPVGLTSVVVGTRTPSAYTGSGNGNPGFNGRLKDFLAADCGDLRLVYSTPLNIDNAGPSNTVLTEVGIEPTIGGSIIPVTFRGRTFGAFDSDGLIVSDPIPGFFPKGTAIWYRTFGYTETSVVGTWTTTSGSTTATLANLAAYALGKGKLTVGAFIFGSGITGFTTTVTAVSLDQLTVTLSAAASSSATGVFYSNAGQAQVTHSGYIGASEYGGVPTGTSPNLSKSGTITSASGNTTGPTCVLADRIYGTTPPCVLLLGDSITAGTGWTATDYASRSGTSYATIALGAGGLAGTTPTYGYPLINLGKPSETAATFASISGSYRRRKLWGFGTHATCLYGINDLGGGATMTTIQANLISIWTDLAREGIKTWACTLGPKNNSSDSFTTQGGLSKTYTVTVEGYRTGINDWIRDGAPILAGVAAAAGSSAGGTLRAGATGHPLSGYFDTADQWETSRNSGIWQISLVYATDGLGVHPNNAGHVAGATAINPALFV